MVRQLVYILLAHELHELAIVLMILWLFFDHILGVSTYNIDHNQRYSDRLFVSI